MKKNLLLLFVLALGSIGAWACDDGPEKKESTLDADGDGVPDDLDVCAGHDDRLDADGDRVPDGCDICPAGMDQIDRDRDGVPDACDACEGYDDRDDADGDGVPDACDACRGHDDHVDRDLDGRPDGCDVCDGHDDRLDADGDGVPDGCDDCPMTGFECNLCYQACEYTNYECEVPVCVDSVVDCAAQSASCESACMLDTPCDRIATLVTQAPDPDLSACLDTCAPNNACHICFENRCEDEVVACRQDVNCSEYLTCIDPCLDADCEYACFESHGSEPTTYLSMCLWDECAVACADLFTHPQ